ncbi:FIST signal transduction protein [Tepidimonas sp. HKU79]|uniref:FIST signal transduction protein n=1 Tax=unclassified Tepidimonas TaxID=2631705 RepID=UPI003C7E2D2A
MKRFVCAHATHPQWPVAAALVVTQLRAQLAARASAAPAAGGGATHGGDAGHTTTPLALVYLTDHYAGAAAEILAYLGAELPQVTDWVGAVGVGIGATGVEYWDEPALVVMLCDLAPGRYRVFSGVAPLGATQGPEGFIPQTALVHADPTAPDLAELLQELAERTLGHYLFGGLVASRAGSVQMACASQGGLAGHGREAAVGLFRGGFSGVAFGPDVGIVSRVTQGVRAVGPAHRVSAAHANRVESLDGQPALDVVLQDLGLSLDDLTAVIGRLRQTLVGLQAPVARPASAAAPLTGRVPLRLGDDVLVRHLVGIDPLRRAVVVADEVPTGALLTLCERHVQAARADLVRICAEIRDELSPEGDDTTDPTQRIAGAIYVSCNGRGGAHFGGPSAELQIVRQALGDVPLAGFFAAGEIAHHRLYGYTGVLTVFVADAADPSGAAG